MTRAEFKKPDQEFGGGWTEQKLQILDNYLAAYSKIFRVNPRARHLDTIYVMLSPAAA